MGAALALVASCAALLAAPGDAADRARFDTDVLALVPFPGYPARAYVHPNGRIYEGTYESDAGAAVPSRVFEYSGDGRLIRGFTIDGQTLGEPHGIQAALSDAEGRLVLLDTLPARVLILDLHSRRQGTYANFPDIPLCTPGETTPSCSPAAVDNPPIPNYAAWGPDGSLYVTDYGQAVVWRVPPGGGVPEVWLADRRLDGIEFGTTGIMLEADQRTLMIGQGSSAGGGDGDPTTGKIYEVAIGDDGAPGELTKFWESGPTDLPDGFAIAASGNLYVPLVGTTAQIAVVDPNGNEIERFPDAPFGGDNGSPVPFDSPSSAMFLGTRLIVANQSAVMGDATHQAILDVEAGEPGLDPLIPASAGRKPGTVACTVRKLRPGRRGAGKPKQILDTCDIRVKVGKAGSRRFRLQRTRGRVVQRGRVEAGERGRVIVGVEGVEPARYRLIVGKGNARRIRLVRVRIPL